KLYDYNARYYDPAIGRFIQPDTIVPEPANPQALNRYAYVNNNPVRYTDPSGHCLEAGLSPIPCEPLLQEGVELVQQAEALTVQYGPQVAQFLQAYGEKLPAAMDRLAQFARSAGKRVQKALQGGEPGNAGGLDPNDPWSKFNELVNQGVDPIEAAVRASTQGSGDRFVIGPYNTEEGVLNYIEEANVNGGKYFDAGQKLWKELEREGLTEEVNRRVIYEQMKAGISRIELSSGETIEHVLKFRPNSWTAKEIQWIQEFAERFGYIRNEAGTGWIKLR
ncbi:RHS repeat-associated core domain-containing protein, partial [Candidatus Parcubacteria bacterium]